MAHRQTNRDGLHIRHELTSANDSDTAHREVLRRMETYGKDPDASDYEVAKDTVLLLRALNHRLRHFKAQILADIKIREYNQTLRPQPQTDTPSEARDRRYTLPSTTPPTEVRRPEHTHTSDDGERRGFSPIWQPKTTEEIRPQTKSSASGTMMSDEPRPPDAGKDKSTNEDPVDPNPQANEITTNQQQLQTPEHATPVKSDDDETSTATDHTGIAHHGFLLDIFKFFQFLMMSWNVGW